ncbi:hypothetical protein SanaruYs_18870 [Chryseotalea sanaruensis]|uniref:Uncharacterized protein n=1 Tax=Chryseotalea sanaruensis TaxID=2482724 RepID=A0A401U9U6_9BACT|nr:hypothetical protein [Chryseotalea sanaruensis]GCC51659.1 hypothetical protein SanaruYs_18870 [Chryseotalea sanaruensis]
MSAAINTTDHIIFLIGEELKSRRFFNTFQELGLDDSYFQPHLDEAIMTCLGLDDSNATLDFYFAVMNEHASKIGIKSESVAEEAKRVYEKLVANGMG